MIKQLKLKLAKMLSKFAEVTTDKGVLICDGEMVIGKEVFLVDADGEYVSAPNGDYIDGETTYKVMDGIISEIVMPEVEEPEVVEPEENLEVEPEVEPVEEPEPDPEPAEQQTTIEDVANLVNDLVEVVKNLDIRISQLETQNTEFSKLINESAGTPIETLLKKDDVIKDNKFERISNAIKKIKTN